MTLPIQRRIPWLLLAGAPCVLCLIAIAPVPRMAAAGGIDNDDEALRVLFIGNSFTYGGDIPGLVETLSRSKPGLRPIVVGREVVPCYTLEQHWERGRALQSICSHAWDVVVLQEQSQRPMLEPARMLRYARLFNEEIRRHGARTVLYMTWADSDRPGDQATLASRYDAVARELKADVAPVGLAWGRACRERPCMPLHADDKHHQGHRGAYLTACVFVALLSGDPMGLPREVMHEPEHVWELIAPKPRLIVEPEEAAYFQRIAREVMQR